MTESAVAVDARPNNPRWRVVLVAVATALSLLVTLSAGVWQLGRAKQKEAMQAQWEARAALPALAAADVFTSAVDAKPRQEREDLLLQRVVTLQGRWLPEHTVFLDNRPLYGRAGFYVLTPFVEAASGRWLLVQRGWVPRDVRDRSRVPPIETTRGPQNLTARVAAAPSRALDLGGGEALAPGVAQDGATPRIRQNLELAAYARELGHPLWDFLLLQVGDDAHTTPTGGMTALLRDWPAPQFGIEKHLGYAFQWFGLALLIASLYVWFQIVPRFRRRGR